jgi:hypothetical protein
MPDTSNKPDDDGKIDHIENFLRPLEKQSREELDRMFAKAAETIAESKRAASSQKTP